MSRMGNSERNFIVLEIAPRFYTMRVTLYNNASTVGGTTKVRVTAENSQRNRSWKRYGHTSKRCCGKWDSRLRSTLKMTLCCSAESIINLNVGARHEGRGSAPAPMA